MQIIKSTYRPDVVFVGHDHNQIADEALAQAIEHATNLDSGRDFDGISREPMRPEHANTSADLNAYVALAKDYATVEFVELQPVR